jgi:hypothetical protein
MPRRKRRPPPKGQGLKLLELQCGVIQHCAALGAVTELLGDGQTGAAVARLDQAVSALHALVRGQAVGQTMACPACGSQQAVVAWVDDGRCDHCGAALEVPE